MLLTNLAIPMKPLLVVARLRRTTISAACNVRFLRLVKMKASIRWVQLTRWTMKLTLCGKFSTTVQFKVNAFNLRKSSWSANWSHDVFTATMWVYPDFFTYRSGIYRRSTHGVEAKGFHSVRLVGWGEERFGYHSTKYWVSWKHSPLHYVLLQRKISYRSLPTHGDPGGEKLVSSRSCVEPTNAALKTMCFHHSPIFTKENQTVGKATELVAESAENHKLIKFPSWYPMVQCNWKSFQSNQNKIYFSSSPTSIVTNDRE